MTNQSTAHEAIQISHLPVIMQQVRQIMANAGLAEVFADPASGAIHLKVKNGSYMDLVIERLAGMDDTGRLCVSVCHYGHQNGDAMRDPEMIFDWQTGEALYYRNDYVGIEQWVYQQGSQRTLVALRLRREQTQFAAQWARNLTNQGFTGTDRIRFSSATHAALVVAATGQPAEDDD